jgi:hypothetical protein
MMSALMDPVGKRSDADVYVPTGGVYRLVSEEALSVEPVSLVPETAIAVEAENSSGAAATELSQALAATVKRWTTGEFLAALMIGAAFSVPAPTPAMHAIVLDPFSYLRATHAPSATQVRDAQVPTLAEGPSAYRAFKELGGWLSTGDDQIADMLGIGRTTPYAWKRDRREPRPETARRVYEYHAVLDSLRRRLGASDFQMWLREGSPARRERLLAGDLESLDRDVHAIVFQPAAADLPDLGWAAEPPSAAAISDASGAAPRRAGRRPRRARLT